MPRRSGLPMPHRRTFTTGILPFVHSMLLSLRRAPIRRRRIGRGFARPATPAPGARAAPRFCPSCLQKAPSASEGMGAVAGNKPVGSLRRTPSLALGACWVGARAHDRREITSRRRRFDSQHALEFAELGWADPVDLEQIDDPIPQLNRRDFGNAVLARCGGLQ